MPRKAKKLYYHNLDDFRGTAKDFEERYGIKASIFRTRVDQYGWSVPRACSEDVRDFTRKTSEFNYNYHGLNMSLSKLAEYFNISYQVLNSELKKLNKSPDDSDVEKIIDLLIAEKKNKELNIISNNKNNSLYKKELEKKKKESIINNTLGNDLRTSSDGDTSSIHSISKKVVGNVIQANLENNTVYNPILDWCLINHKNYNLIMNRIYNKGMTFSEASTMRSPSISIKNVIYKGQITNVKTICNRYKLDFTEVYNLYCELYDFEYIIDTLRKRNKYNNEKEREFKKELSLKFS